MPGMLEMHANLMLTPRAYRNKNDADRIHLRLTNTCGITRSMGENNGMRPCRFPPGADTTPLPIFFVAPASEWLLACPTKKNAFAHPANQHVRPCQSVRMP
eukprot:gnl/MRDRNA2_/MRDRNA2_67595_c0_seq4.p1 gnl/MRDRNA2_/MRDRNA2_67595_c0~~gnl/MRDRNA2_/MRDRNA2_67595_c0_seq4.p1  ORF type:complete len:101 (+),score=6.79 gnl/MRDRNA2_/MRDRNA2_67595_c0_seq4:86-388(+)